VALLGLYPLWWLLGLGAFAFIVFAVPMAVDLGRRRRLTVPRGFGFWLLFLLWAVGSLLMFPLSPPNTIAGSAAGGRSASRSTRRATSPPRRRCCTWGTFREKSSRSGVSFAS
jgi:hypothetical protein